MLSIPQIQRLIDLQSHHTLASRVLSNGRCHCSQLRAFLLGRCRVPVVAVGLALQRICELTYHPAASGVGPDAVDRLLSLQTPRGLFGDGEDLAGSAVALAGLLKWRSLCAASGAEGDARLDAAINRGMNAITEAIEQYEPDRAGDEQAIAIAAVLWQLGDIEAFRQRCEVSRLLAMIEPYHARAVDAAVWHYAAAKAA